MYERLEPGQWVKYISDRPKEITITQWPHDKGYVGISIEVGARLRVERDRDFRDFPTTPHRNVDVEFPLAGGVLLRFSLPRGTLEVIPDEQPPTRVLRRES